MKLSERLMAVASFVDKGAAIADVGSDHAELPIYLFENNRISFAETIENKRGPYAAMAKAIVESGYLNQCRLSLSDGLTDLDSRVDTVVLAGMGGQLVARILLANPKKLATIKTLIVDAHSERPAVVAALASLSYRIVDNTFLFDGGIPYDILKAVRSETPVLYSEKEKLFGPLNLIRKPKDWVRYWQEEERMLIDLLAKPTLPAAKKAECLQKISEIKEALR